MSATPIAQTGNALSKADLNAEFPRFLRGRSNQNADETAVWKTAFSSKGFITQSIEIIGAGEGIRTLDPNIGKIRLYEISVLNQLFIKLLKNPNTIRTFAAQFAQQDLCSML